MLTQLLHYTPSTCGVRLILCAKLLLSGVAEELLQLETMDHATKAIKQLCRSELTQLSQSGAFERAPQSPSGSLLWSLLTMMSRFCYAETQSIEGLNSVVKLLGRRCPHITLELLSSRLAIKRMLGQADGATGCRKKWSVIKELAEREVADLTQYATQALPILADASRWSNAASVPFPAQHAIQGDPATPCVIHDHTAADLQAELCSGPGSGFNIAAVSPATVAWAKSYNLGWKWRTGGGKRKPKQASNSKVKQQHSQCGFGVAILPTPDMQEIAYYLTADYFSHSVSFTRLKVYKQRIDGHDHLQDCVKWEHDRSQFADTVESTLLFARYFDTCSRHDHCVPVRACFLDPSCTRRLFVSPGWLRVDDINETSVHLFDMTAAHMKGVSIPKQKSRKPASKPEAADASSAGADAEQASTQPSLVEIEAEDHDHECEVVEGEAEHAYLHGDHGHTELHDTSGSESDDCVGGVGDDDGANIASAEHATRELQTSVGTATDMPSRKDIARATHQIAEAGCVAPVPEMEEEALLLLVRQRNASKQQRRTSGKSQPVFDGVGDTSNVAALAAICSDETGSDDALATTQDELSSDVTFFGHTLAGIDDSNLHAMHSWAAGCIKTLRALRAVHNLQEGKDLGSHKSISLVNMKSQRVDGCSCVRCKWGSDVDMPETLFVHWLNNSPTYGLMGRKARQVNLDSDNKVLYSASDTTMQRTGVRSGLGFPEMVCDDAHCDIVIGHVGASMRKIKKTSPERDVVPSACLDIMAFCMLLNSRLAITSVDGNAVNEEAGVRELSCLRQAQSP